ncbi:Ig-like domain-containing protein, partial [Pseudahrensia aquimaris]
EDGFTGDATFDYTVEDEDGLTDTGSVTVAVSDNTVDAIDDDIGTRQDTPVTIPVLDNDVDPDGDTFEVTDFDTTTANGGTVTQNADGELVYTPAPGFSGSDTFEYTITDAKGNTDTATVSVHVDENTTNAVNDERETDFDTPITIDVLGNDNDPEGDTFEVSDFDATSANGGTITENADGTLTYTPAAGFEGTDTFEYTITDSMGATDTATVTVTVGESELPPVAEDDQAALDAPGGSVTIDVLANDDDPDGNNANLTVTDFDATTPNGGTVTQNADGTLEYTGAPGFEGTDTFEYTITDEDGLTDTATVTIVVDAAPVPPVAEDDTAANPGTGGSVTIDVLANDDDPDGDNANLTVTDFDMTTPNGGTVTQNADGTLEYTPAPGFTGGDTFEYTITDEDGLTSTATVVITPVESTVDAVDDNTTTDANMPVSIDVLGNDTDPDGDTFEVTDFDMTTANGGTVTENADGTLEYTPAADFIGTDTFEYTITDETGVTDTATVTVTVEQPNDTDAVDDTAETTPSTPVVIDVLANDVDAQGDSQSVQSFTNGANGTVAQNAAGELVYIPNAGFEGTDTFTYTVVDAQGATDTATVTVTVAADNDTNAVDDAETTNVDTPVTIDVLANDTDDQGDAQTIQSFDMTSAEGGMIAQNANGELVYIPPAGFVGTDTFEYTVVDAEGATDTATVTVTVEQPNTTDAVDDAATTTPGTMVMIDVLANDVDDEGDIQTITSFDGTSANGGTVLRTGDGQLVYIPAAGFQGEDTFTYTITDARGATDTATVTVTVGEPNSTNAVDDAAETMVDVPVTIDVLANDTDDQGDAQSIQSFDMTSANGGMVAQNANGELVYIPPAGFMGTDTFEYTVVDDDGATDTATVTVTVGEPNDTNAVDDDATTTVGVPVTIDVLANDTDDQGDAQTIQSFDMTSANGGMVAQNANGELVYIPPAGFTGTDTFEYTVIDERGETDTATVTVTVGVINDTNAVDDADTTALNTPVTIDVLANDTDDQGDAQSIDSFDMTSANGGMVLQTGDGQLVYIPATGFTGTDTFEYTVIDAQGATDTATVTVTVEAPTNNPPVGKDDMADTPQGTPVVIDVLANDSDPDGDPIMVMMVGTAQNGTVVLNDDGTVTYTPNDGFTGMDSFTYVLKDDQGGSDVVNVMVNVEPDNNDPDAVDDATVNTGLPQFIDVLTNDSDPDMDPLTIIGTTPPSNGSVIVTMDGQIVYIPNPGYTGPDEFTYTISDGKGGTDTATVTITGDDNDTTANDDADTTNINTPVTIDVLANDTDDQGDAQMIQSFDPTSANGGTVAQGANGQLVYIPPTGFTGTDTFEYVVVDDQGATDTATVTVTVVDPTPNDTTANDDADTTNINTPVTIDVLANDTDDQGDAQMIQSFDPTSANGGTVAQGANGQLVYIPPTGFTGTDTFEYVVVDDQGATDTATVTVTVVDPTPNDTTANNDVATTDSGTPVSIDVLANDTDDQGDAQMIQSFDPTSANGGTVTQGANGELVYTPAAGFTGTDTFTYVVVDDQGATDTATVTVTVNNQKPDAVDDVATTGEGDPVEIMVLMNDSDPEGDPLSIVSLGTPANGTVAIGPNGKPIYTPNPGFTGMDTFTYTITDGNGGFSTAEVKVTVEADPDLPPVAVDDAATTPSGTPVAIDVLVNDNDPDGGMVTVTSVTNGANGTVTIGADGRPVYTPNAGFTGTDTFTYVITDDEGETDTATVTVTVENQDPDAVDDTATTTEGDPVSIMVLMNDNDPEGQDLTIIGTTNGSNGMVTIGADGKPVYTPNAGFTGTDTFTYTISDGNGGTDTATVTVTINPDPNRPPDAVDDVADASDGTPIMIDVLGNDSDPDGDPLMIIGTTQPGKGTIIVQANGMILYTPNAGATGTDTFTYTIKDGNGGEDTATVTVDLGPDPAPNVDPVAVDDMKTVDLGDPIVIDVLENDTDADGDPLEVINVTDGTNGTVTINADGTVTYTPNDPNFTGMDMFTYTISDGNGGTDTAVVKVTIEDDEPNMIMGTEGNDKLIKGTDGDDLILGKGGHDCIEVSNGDDILDGGKGFDLVTFGSGSSSDYTFEANSDGTVTVVGDTGTDLLIDIESVYFEESKEWFKIEDLVDH